MNREIKFRAFDLEYKIMYYNVVCGRNIVIAQLDEEELEENDSFKPTYYTTENISQERPQVFEIMQYTGLKDKNGIEIYEGDIIIYKDYTNGAILSLKGEDKQPRRAAVIKLENIVTGFKAYGMADFDVRHIEVIGNIHQNPELLNQ